MSACSLGWYSVPSSVSAWRSYGTGRTVPTVIVGTVVLGVGALALAIGVQRENEDL
jgi:hypothetical protein